MKMLDIDIDNSTIAMVVFTVFISILICSQLNVNHHILSSNSIEGFESGTNSKSVASTVKKEKDKVLDSLHIDKYRSNYENIVTDMKLWCDAQILKTITSDSISTSDGLTNDNLKKIAHVNSLREFKVSCDDALELIDNN